MHSNLIKKTVALALGLFCGGMCFAAQSGASYKPVRVGCFEQADTYYSLDEKTGRMSGYAYDYDTLISQYAGWKIQYVKASFSELLEMLEAGEIDVLSDVSFTKERDQKYLFSTNDVGSEYYYIFIPKEENDLDTNNINSLDGKKIGLARGTVQSELLEEFLKEKNLKANIVYWDAQSEFYQLLEEGEIDAFVNIDHFFLEGYKTIAKIGKSDIYYAVNRHRPDLLSDVNYAIQKIQEKNPYYSNFLQLEYLDKKLVSDLNYRSELTWGEKLWLQRKQKIKIGFLDNYLPYSDYNHLTGKTEGLIVSVADVIEKEFWTEVQLIPYQRLEDLNYDLIQGTIDVKFPQIDDYWLSGKKHIMQTDNIASDVLTTVYSKSVTEPNPVISYTWSSPVDDKYLSVIYPDAVYSQAKSIDVAINAVRKGKTSFYADSNNVILHYLDSKQISLMRASFGETINYCFGVREGNYTMWQIMNKALSYIPKDEISRVVLENTMVPQKYSFKQFLKANINIVFFIVIIVAGLLISLLAALLEKTKDSYNLERKLEAEKNTKALEVAFKNERQSNYLARSFGKLFYASYYVDLFEGSYVAIETPKDSGEIDSRGGADSAENIAAYWIEQELTDEYRKEFQEFSDLSTLGKRLRGKDSVNIDFLNSNGKWSRASFIPVDYAENGKLHHVIFAVRLIESEKQIELEAKKANDAKTRFLSSMSHDIRTPMNAILGMTQIAEMYIDDKERVADCLDKIRSSSDHLLSLINDTLDLTRIESGKTVITHELCDLRVLLQNIESITRGYLTGRNLDFSMDCHLADSPFVLTDELHLRQVLINVISNAVKYTPDGGKITFSLICEKPATTFDNRIIMHFSVSDTGIGMTEEFQKKIFEPFSQAEEGARTQYKGSGLGMALVKQFVELMGAGISIHSKLGSGTTVYMDFPTESVIHIEKKKVPEGNTDSDLKDLTGIKILLAEDNDMNRRIASVLLKKEGADVTSVINGKEAVEVFADSEVGLFDVILMDIMMPVMDGYEATRQIREMASSRPDAVTTPIIAMTANAFREDIQMSLRKGMDDHISKPIEMALVNKTIKKYVHK